jgi:uncharacterized protein
MVKVAVLALIVIVMVFLIRNAARKSAMTRRTQEAAQTRMVPCAHCGVHLPQFEAIAQENLFYCSEAHRLAGPA